MCRFIILGGKAQIQFMALRAIHMIQIELLAVQAVVKDVYKYVFGWDLIFCHFVVLFMKFIFKFE